MMCEECFGSDVDRRFYTESKSSRGSSHSRFFLHYYAYILRLRCKKYLSFSLHEETVKSIGKQCGCVCRCGGAVVKSETREKDGTWCDVIRYITFFMHMCKSWNIKIDWERWEMLFKRKWKAYEDDDSGMAVKLETHYVNFHVSLMHYHQPNALLSPSLKIVSGMEM